MSKKAAKNIFPNWKTDQASVYRFQPVNTPSMPVGSWDFIYADPPWRYDDNLGFDSARGAPDYPTMPFDQIAALDVKSIRNKNSLLGLWCTWPMIVEGRHIELAEAWGFKLVCLLFAWAKLNSKANPTMFTAEDFRKGLGWWTMGMCEVAFGGIPIEAVQDPQERESISFCFLGRSGTPQRDSKSVRELQIHPVTTHSAKPPEIRRQIDRLVGNWLWDRDSGIYRPARKLEMFARDQVDGWDGWGLESEKRLNVEEVL